MNAQSIKEAQSLAKDITDGLPPLLLNGKIKDFFARQTGIDPYDDVDWITDFDKIFLQKCIIRALASSPCIRTQKTIV